MLVLSVAITLAGYVLFTWRNPFFAVLKASFVLSLSVPFAYYTSEVLDDWMRRSDANRIAIWTVLTVLTVLISATFTFSELFWNMDHMSKPGVVW
jgi:type VI protein secretion system component VasK